MAIRCSALRAGKPPETRTSRLTRKSRWLFVVVENLLTDEVNGVGVFISRNANQEVVGFNIAVD